MVVDFRQRLFCSLSAETRKRSGKQVQFGGLYRGNCRDPLLRSVLTTSTKALTPKQQETLEPPSCHLSHHVLFKWLFHSFQADWKGIRGLPSRNSFEASTATTKPPRLPSRFRVSAKAFCNTTNVLLSVMDSVQGLRADWQAHGQLSNLEGLPKPNP